MNYYLYGLMLLIFVPLFGLSLFDHYLYSKAKIEVLNKTIIHYADNLEELIVRNYSEEVRKLINFAIDQEYFENFTADCVKRTNQIISNNPDLIFMGIANANGEFICGYPNFPINNNICYSDFINSALESKEIVVSSCLVSSGSNVPLIIYGYSITNSKTNENYIIIRIQDPIKLQPLLFQYLFEENLEVYYYDANRNLLVSTKGYETQTYENDYENDISQNDNYLNISIDNLNSFQRIKVNGSIYYIYSSEVVYNQKIIGYLTLKFVGSTMYGKALKPLFSRIGELLLLSIIIYFTSHLLIQKNFILPFIKIKEFLGRIEAKKYSERLETKSNLFEIKILENSLNRLVESLDQEIHLKNDLYKRISLLNQIDRHISQSQDIQKIFPIILDGFRALFKVQASTIMIYDKNSNQLLCVASTGFHIKGKQESDFPYCEKIARNVFNEGKPIYIRENQNQVNDFLLHNIDDSRFRLFYGNPIIKKNEIIGVFGIYEKDNEDLEDALIEFIQIVCDQISIAIENSELIVEIQKKNEDLSKAYDKTILGWSKALELRDDETFGHTERVTEMTVGISKKLGFSDDIIRNFKMGALLHDIGKIGIPDFILLKQGPLTQEEREIINKHPVFAYNLLQPIEYLKDALNIPYYHHERWDGSGYPTGIKGEDIPIEARIFAIIDVWDALRSDRVYRKAWSDKKVIEYLKEKAGKEFDPILVEVFLEYMQYDQS